MNLIHKNSFRIFFYKLKNRQSSNSEYEELSQSLKRDFKKRSCFLLPHPGPAILRKDYNGNSNGKKKKIFDPFQFHSFIIDSFKELDTRFVSESKAFFASTIDTVLTLEKSDDHLKRAFRDGQNIFNIFKVCALMLDLLFKFHF